MAKKGSRHNRDGRFRGPQASSRRLDQLTQQSLRQRVPAEDAARVDEPAHADDDRSPERARAGRRLTTKELATRRGVSVWAIEQSETAAQNGVGAASQAAATAEAPDPAKLWGEIATRAGRGWALVLLGLTVILVIRFFTEVFPILPRPLQFIDIPIFFVIVAAALLGHRTEAQANPDPKGKSLAPIVVLSFLFLVVYASAVLTNLSRIDLAPALVFLYGVLGPLALALAVYRLWPVGAALRLSRLLVAIGLVEIAIVLLIDVPRYLADQNPDVVSGTFGENPYQLVFLLLVLVGLLTGMYSCEKHRRVVRFVPLLLLLIVAIILLAQYRSLLLTMALTVVLLGYILSRSGARGLVVSVLAAATLFGTLTYAVQNVPALKFGSALEKARNDPTLYVKKRVQTMDTIGRLFADEPRYAITGTGPGTYSSRAWSTFARTTLSETDVVGEYIVNFTGGRRYSTDVADKYVLPQLASLEVVDGSYSVTSPLSSYLSLLAETGLLGFALIVAAYVWAFVSSLRMTLISVRTAQPGDPLPALLCATTVAFFVLLQMAILENWLEVTRITFLSWILFALVTKEFHARARGALNPEPPSQ